jgi:hypothetical protein
MENSRAKIRSRVTNQPHHVAGFDGRTSEGRSRRDLMEGYALAKGGISYVSAAQWVDIGRRHRTDAA